MTQGSRQKAVKKSEPRKRILVVEDEDDARELIRMSLDTAGFEVIEARDGSSGIFSARQSAPSLIILDVMLPDMSGLEICRNLKGDPHVSHIPILFLTAKATEIDRILGLEMGAEDYVTKPFSPRELVLRVKAHLRSRSAAASPQAILRAGNITMDTSTHCVQVKNQSIPLTPIEFKLLHLLIDRHPRVLSRETLLQEVWGHDRDVDIRTVDVNIRRLRKKLGKDGNAIGTSRGFGYRIIQAG